MLYISERRSGTVPHIDFLRTSFSFSKSFNCPRDDDAAQLYMEYNNVNYTHPYQPNPMSDDTYLHPSYHPEEQSSHSYANVAQHQASQSHVQPSDSNQYHMGSSGPGQLYNQEMAWGSTAQPPFESHSAGIPHHGRDVHQSSSEYSTYPHATQFPPSQTGPPHNITGGGPSQFNSAGPTDPNTGMFFYPSTEGPRLRTAQACQKCRARKAKCSGDHPSCERCLMRGLVCEYSTEGRARGYNSRPRVRVDTGSSHGRADPSSPDPTSAGHSEYIQSPNDRFGYAGGNSISRRAQDPSYTTNSQAGNATNAPIGVYNPYYGAEMTTDTQYQRNAGSWQAQPGFDRYYDHPQRHAPP